MLSGGATNTNFIVFGLTRWELEPTRGEHANHYTTNAVELNNKDFMSVKIQYTYIVPKYEIYLYEL